MSVWLFVVVAILNGRIIGVDGHVFRDYINCQHQRESAMSQIESMSEVLPEGEEFMISKCFSIRIESEEKIKVQLSSHLSESQTSPYDIVFSLPRYGDSECNSAKRV